MPVGRWDTASSSPAELEPQRQPAKTRNQTRRFGPRRQGISFARWARAALVVYLWLGCSSGVVGGLGRPGPASLAGVDEHTQPGVVEIDQIEATVAIEVVEVTGRQRKAVRPRGIGDLPGEVALVHAQQDHVAVGEIDHPIAIEVGDDRV